MALKKKMKAGDEIQARCTKCKKTSAHTIVAMVDKEIVKVECLVCGSTHKYHPPEPEKAEPAKKAARKEPRKAEKAETAPKGKPQTGSGEEGQAGPQLQSPPRRACRNPQS